MKNFTANIDYDQFSHSRIIFDFIGLCGKFYLSEVVSIFNRL